MQLVTLLITQKTCEGVKQGIIYFILVKTMGMLAHTTYSTIIIRVLVQRLDHAHQGQLISVDYLLFSKNLDLPSVAEHTLGIRINLCCSW